MLGAPAATVNNNASADPAVPLAERAKLMAAVGQPPQIPPPTPPSCSECASKTQPAAGGAPTQSASRMWRSGDGKTRIDTPQSSIISDPVSQQTIVLDHVKKEASVIPMAPPGAAAPQASAAPGSADAGIHPSSVQVQDLGKSMIEGHEVEGKRYTFPGQPSPPKPPMPAMPGLKSPGAPGAPNAPQASASPQAPKAPPPPNIAEVWTSVKLKTPVLTKVTTPVGEQTTYCKPTESAEHPPSVFQIPPGYKIKPNP